MTLQLAEKRAISIDLCQGMTLQLAEKRAISIDLCQGMTLVVPKEPLKYRASAPAQLH